MGTPMTPDEIRAMNERVAADTRARLAADPRFAKLEQAMVRERRRSERVRRVARRMTGWLFLASAAALLLTLVPGFGWLMVLPAALIWVAFFLSAAVWISCALFPGSSGGGIDASGGFSDGGL